MTIYVDPAVAGPGTGTIGDPYNTTQLAIDNWVNFATSGEILIANTSPDVLAATINWTLFNGASSSNILKISSYDAGGSQFWTMADGTTIPYGEIDANGAAVNLFSTTSIPTYVEVSHLFLHGTTGGCLQLGHVNARWVVYECDIRPGTDAFAYGFLGSRCSFFRNRVIVETSNTRAFSSNNDNDISYNFFDIQTATPFEGGSLANNDTYCRNILNGIAASTNGVRCSTGDHIYENTFIGQSLTASIGVNILGFLSGDITSNLFVNLATGVNSTGGTGNLLYNVFSGVTNRTAVAGGGLLRQIVGNQTIAAAFKDSALDNFELAGMIAGAGAPPSFWITNTNHYLDPGAVQREPGSGGGVFPRNRYRGY